MSDLLVRKAGLPTVGWAWATRRWCRFLVVPSIARSDRRSVAEIRENQDRSRGFVSCNPEKRFTGLFMAPSRARFRSAGWLAGGSTALSPIERSPTSARKVCTRGLHARSARLLHDYCTTTPHARCLHARGVGGVAGAAEPFPEPDLRGQARRAGETIGGAAGRQESIPPPLADSERRAGWLQRRKP